MKALTDYIHAKGLKAGIYTSPGPADLCRPRRRLAARRAGRRAVRRVGFRFPEIRLVFLRQDREGQEPGGIPEALPPDQRDPQETAAGHRPQPLPVRYGKCLGMGEAGRRQQLAHRRATWAALSKRSARRCSATGSTSTPRTSSHELRRPGRLERPGLSPPRISQQLEGADASPRRSPRTNSIPTCPSGAWLPRPSSSAATSPVSTLSRSAC